ncbi:hypothetical protein B0H16DRAFT_964506 [Mycena metata]|uniref:Glutamine synthetase n=1 Tax=Mycena metata TaxID=1033252 RepID=A0AAD7IM79_9AGAR|nr:hypothetical protein B0H16DRAFT_964506 [Mycena metata]
MDYSHGVVHTPKSVLQGRKWDVKALDDPTVSYVRIYWVDLVNVHRCRIVPVDYFKRLLKSNRPGVVVAKASLGLIYLMVVPGFLPVGEFLYTLDLATLKPCPFAPGHMAVLGQFEEKTAVPDDTGSLSVKVNLCPRSLLRRILEQTKQSTNTEFLVGFESEFILLKSTDPIEPIDVHDFAASTGLLAGAAQTNALQEIADAITASGIVLEMYHAEAAPGQYEVVTGPLTPLEAADALIHTREIIVQIAAKHGLHATFAPRPFPNSTGSSTHAHISVHAAGEEKTAEGLSKHEKAFLAGVLDHLPAIVALSLPTHASYKRVGDGLWSGGSYVCWGTENREASLRLTNATSPGSRNFEARFIDGTANPHLALAALFAGAFTGLESMKELEVLDCSGVKSAAELTEDERLALGITKRLPLNIEDARKNLEQDSALCELLTRDFVETYLSVNRTLQAALCQDETEAQELTRLVKFY